ncbi:hypothetical protein K1719_021056 [Acacia pycnantha]|nr:hypothetical protein K1719_021056 [Acacia pycnantha]
MLLADEKGSRIEVSATHKNLIDKLMDQPREGIVYNFQNFQENDDKYRITTTPWKFNFHNHTYIEEADVVISNEAYNLKTIPEIQQGNEETTEMVEESVASRQTVCTESQDNVIEDDDNTLSQLITPPEANTKRKTLGNDIPVVCEDLGLLELCTPKMSSTKPMKNIKKEK